MDNEKLPIKLFAHRQIDELRVEPGGNNEEPNWVLHGVELKQHASNLAKRFELLSSLAQKRSERISQVPFVFIAKMYNDATAKSRRNDISMMFQNGYENNVIGLTAVDQLIVKVDSLLEINSIFDKLKNYESNKYAISCLEDFFEFKPMMEMDSNENVYKVKLMDFQNFEINNSVQRLFEKILSERNIEYKKIEYAKQYPIYKVKVTQDCIDFNSDEIQDMLFSIEPMPRYIVAVDELLDRNSVDILKPNEDKNYKVLGILDSGIAKIPNLDPWLEDERWTVYPDNEINPSHGTFVAGIALYGDLCENKNWVGHNGIKLFDAAVFPNNSGIDEDELIANISEVIKIYHKKIKIWNLSISVARPVSDDKFSDFAIALDDLQDKYNILICKSAGNCCNFRYNRPKTRINEGADSIRSLVVGSVAHKKGRYDLVDVDNPSPFSCVGPAPEFIIKPEVSHYGGNVGINKNGRITTTGVTSFSADNHLCENVGTSFSTPRIAALATGLYQEMNEDFDPLLLKALIIHSASYSDKLTIPETERTNQLGFGVPKNISQILYNSPHEATLILRNTLEKGEKIDIMDFPMPKSLIKNGYYTGQIIVTLVYDPILDPSQGVEYCQSNIDVKFGSYDEKYMRDISKRNILNPVGRNGSKNLLLGGIYSKKLMRDNNSDFALKERLLIQYGDKYYPVKKYAVDLAELSETNKRNFVTNDKKWFLFINGLFRDHLEQKARHESRNLNQEFCLIITIRDPEGKANVYDDVTQQLDANNFWHSNIKIDSEVSVSLDNK